MSTGDAAAVVVVVVIVVVIVFVAAAIAAIDVVLVIILSILLFSLALTSPAAMANLSLGAGPPICMPPFLDATNFTSGGGCK
jgi:hypothetical protein